MESQNIDKMRAGVDARFSIKMRQWRGLMRPLSIYEQNVIVAEVTQDLQQKPKAQQNGMMENSLLSIKILARASTSDVDKTDFMLTELELQKLTAKEIEFLYAEYVAACDRMNPRIEELSKAEIDVLIDECKKKEAGLPSALTELSFWQLWNVARSSLTPDERPPAK